MNSDIDKIGWAILDSLSDDYESFEMIAAAVRQIAPNADDNLIQQRIDELLISGLLRTMAKFENYYGMTTEGSAIWEEHTRMYSDEPIDWSKSWTLDVDHKTLKGHVCGTNRQVCESALAKHAGTDIVVDVSTLRHSSIDGFDAKYYKKIKGGHRIDFTFTIKAK